MLDAAQAAPQYPAAPEMIDHMIAAVRDAHGGDYVELDGLPKLREAVALELTQDYGGVVHPEQVLICAGCNQAFCLTVSALAEPGDEVILALPYYFNHDMWLRLWGVVPVYLEPGPDLVPTPEAAAALIGPRTRAIVLVSPGNPTGATMASDSIGEFAALARQHGIALVLDETYRSFRGTSEPAHALFTDPGWADNVVSLHSFSKDLAIPGYRVGAVVASPRLNREIKKLLDCVAICAPRVGQEAAWAGLTLSRSWRAARAREVTRKHALFTSLMGGRPGGFELLSAGGFFGWVRHPFEGHPTDDVVRDLALDYNLLVLSGTAFLPNDRQAFRISFSNLDRAEITDLAERLAVAGTRGPLRRPMFSGHDNPVANS